jgi:hypothetical protein
MGSDPLPERDRFLNTTRPLEEPDEPQAPPQEPRAATATGSRIGSAEAVPLDGGVVLDGLCAAEIALVASLDGSLDLQGLYAAAAGAGVAASRMSALICALDQHHLLVERTSRVERTGDRASLSTTASRDAIC